MRRWTLALAMCALTAGVAQATPASDRRADKLFRDARHLMDGKRFTEACPMLEESQALDPALGTQLNLAVCYTGLGRVFDAYTLYDVVQAAASQAGDADRATLAAQEKSALEPQLGRITVDTAVVPGLTVRIGDRGVLAAQGVVVAPGSYTVTVTAPGYRPFNRQVEARAGAPETVVAKLEPSAAPTASLPVVVHQGDRGHGRRVWAFIVGGTGVALVGLGSVFGLVARSRWHDAKPHCHDSACDAEGLSLASGAGSMADLSTISFAVGGAALATGVVLWLTAPHGTQVEPELAPGHAGISLRGRF